MPVWVAIDPLTSEVYVSDRPTGSIYVYNRDGAYQRTLTLAKPIEGWQPVGIAFDKDGLLYVVDLAGPSPMVEVFDRTANLVRTIGEASQMSFPNGVAVDKDGNVYVADSNNGRLLVFDTAGGLRAQVGRGSGQGNLGLPRGVAVDGGGKVFVGDATGQGLFVFRAPSADEPASRLRRLRRRRGASPTASSRSPMGSPWMDAVASTWRTQATTASRCGATRASRT